MPSASPTAFGPFVESLRRRSLLQPQEAQAVLDLPGRIEQVQAQNDFVLLGDTVEGATFVTAGLVGRFDQIGDGLRQITAVHLPGDAADLHSVVLPRAASALQALTTATVFRVSHDSLRSVAARFPAIAEAFWRHCSVESRIATQWMVNLGRRNAAGRIAHFFCEMAIRLSHGKSPAGTVLSCPLTQAHLADIAGLSVVHVNRVLQSLRRHGILRFEHGEIHIPDWDALIDLAEFDDGYLQNDVTPTRLSVA